MTNKVQGQWEWQEDRRTDLGPGLFGCTIAFMASLDVKVVFDVAKLAVAWKILALTGVHGQVVAGSLAEMKDVTGSACFENCEPTFRF